MTSEYSAQLIKRGAELEKKRKQYDTPPRSFKPTLIPVEDFQRLTPAEQFEFLNSLIQKKPLVEEDWTIVSNTKDNENLFKIKED